MPAMDDLQQVLTVAEVAKLARVGEKAVRQWAADGTLPVVRLGPRTLRFHRDDVDALLRPAVAS